MVNIGKLNNLLIINKFKKLFIINWLRFNKNNYLLKLIDSHIIHYPTPINLTYAWSFGSLAGLCLIIQIISGIFLAIHYIPNMKLAFNSIQYIMRDIEYGWFIRYIHANGASMFFIIVYMHLFRGFYYGSYMKPREFIWCSGILILLLMMGTAFTGYVLPWGQMSFWGATVITSMVSILPKGQLIVEWLWGGFVIKDPTLRRFFVIHFFLPFVIIAFSLVHLILLHKTGSNNPIGCDYQGDYIFFYPYFIIKDLLALALFLLVFSYFIFYNSEYLNHPDNYIKANPMKTPLHVVPEWYFLVFYAILRGIPHKTIGILAMFGSIIILLIIPFINQSIIRNTYYRPVYQFYFWLFIIDCIVLLWIGSMDIKYKRYLIISQFATIYYYLFFILILPISGKIEKILLRINLPMLLNIKYYLTHLKTIHNYHLVDPSPWPILGSLGGFSITIGAVLYMHKFTGGWNLFITGIIILIYTMFFWWQDIIREATFEDSHNIVVQKSLRLAMILFIISEVMFFFAFFWAFFHSSISPVYNIGAVWPPKYISLISFYTIPLTNTFFLLSSGATITWAHHSVLIKGKKYTIVALIFTIVFALFFTILQFFEYIYSPFYISDGIYGSCFFMATGFHGFHVFIGTIAIIISFIRIVLNHFTYKYHFGFEAAIWYWHFVDVIWLFLFINIYWWSNY